MTTDDIERMAREAGYDVDSDGITMPHFHADGPADEREHLTRFAALVRAHAEAEAHAAIDASPAKIIRNSAQGYPGARTPQELTLVDRIKELSQYAADWKRWCMKEEQSALDARAQHLEEAAQECEQWDATHPHRLAAAIRALKDKP